MEHQSVGKMAMPSRYRTIATEAVAVFIRVIVHQLVEYLLPASSQEAMLAHLKECANMTSIDAYDCKLVTRNVR